LAPHTITIPRYNIGGDRRLRRRRPHRRPWPRGARIRGVDDHDDAAAVSVGDPVVRRRRGPGCPAVVVTVTGKWIGRDTLAAAWIAHA
jgi:hypothetical protein